MAWRGRLNRESCRLLLALLNSPESMETFGAYLQSAFYWCHSVYAAVLKKLDDLRAENVALRCKYRNLTTKLRRLYVLVQDLTLSATKSASAPDRRFFAAILLHACVILHRHTPFTPRTRDLSSCRFTLPLCLPFILLRHL